MNRRQFFKGCAALLAGIGVGTGAFALRETYADEDLEEFPDAPEDPEVEPDDAEDPDEPEEGPEFVQHSLFNIKDSNYALWKANSQPVAYVSHKNFEALKRCMEEARRL